MIYIYYKMVYQQRKPGVGVYSDKTNDYTQLEQRTTDLNQMTEELLRTSF